MDYKIRVNRPCRLFIDGEEIQVLNELQLTKIDLAPGEYLRKVVAIDNPSIFDEVVLSISSSKVDLITLDTTGLEDARCNALPEGKFLFGNLWYIANEDKISVSVFEYDKDFPAKELIIPDTINYAGYNYSVTSIGIYAFTDCSKLTSVIIPNSVTSINGAFCGCSSLTSITIPNSVTSIDGLAFYGTGIYTNAANWKNGALYINNCLIEVKEDFMGDYTIKAGTRLIAGGAFCECSSLTSITIPNSVTSIGGFAFSGCSSLTSITIPNSVTEIGDGTFSCCSSLTSITIPNSVTSIGESAFEVCSSLTSINVDSNNPNYSSVDGVLFGKDKTTLVACPGGKQGAYTVPNSVTSIGGWAFCECSSLTSITIPNSVTSIGESAFYGCKSLTSITIPNSVTSIENYTFYGCSFLTSITIPNSVTSIGYAAFRYCSSLTSVTIPNSVTSIGYGAFGGCSSLTSITIPNSVTSIGEGAFLKCSSLTSVKYTGTKEQWQKIKREGWTEGSNIQVVRCTDGEIRL